MLGPAPVLEGHCSDVSGGQQHMRYSIQDPPPCTSLQSTFLHASCTLVLLGTAKPSIYSNNQSMWKNHFKGHLAMHAHLPEPRMCRSGVGLQERQESIPRRRLCALLVLLIGPLSGCWEGRRPSRQPRCRPECAHWALARPSAGAGVLRRPAPALQAGPAALLAPDPPACIATLDRVHLASRAPGPAMWCASVVLWR